MGELNLNACLRPELVEPMVLEHFVGQSTLVQRLRVALDLTHRTGTALPHIQLIGPDGCGKGLLSRILAREVGSPVLRVTGREISSFDHMVGLLRRLENREVLIIDEADMLMDHAQVELARSVRDRSLIVSHPFKAGVRRSSIADVTIIANSRRPVRMTSPLRDLFRIRLRFDSYSHEDLEAVIAQMARRLNAQVAPKAAASILDHALGRPAFAVRLLAAAGQRAAFDHQDRIDLSHVAASLASDGLALYDEDELRRTYMDQLSTLGNEAAPDALHKNLGWPELITGMVESALLDSGVIRVDDDRIKKASGRPGAEDDFEDMPF